MRLHTVSIQLTALTMSAKLDDDQASVKSHWNFPTIPLFVLHFQISLVIGDIFPAAFLPFTRQKTMIYWLFVLPHRLALCTCPVPQCAFRYQLCCNSFFSQRMDLFVISWWNWIIVVLIYLDGFMPFLLQLSMILFWSL